jgi:hypothetical protein
MVSSVEVDDLDIVRVPGPPTEADPPLVIDANAVLSGTITKQLFEAIARWRPEILHLLCRVKDEQFAEHDLQQRRRISPHPLARKQALRVTVSEALDHPG